MTARGQCVLPQLLLDLFIHRRKANTESIFKILNDYETLLNDYSSYYSISIIGAVQCILS